MGGTRHFGAPVRRNEDRRLLTGGGQYVDDIKVPGCLHGAVLRSPFAHARIKAVDTRAARALPGVHLVLTAPDLGALDGPTPLMIPNPSLTHPKTPPPLAGAQVNYAGEPVAFVVADSRYLAEDALELIQVEYEPLPVVADLAAAVQPGAPLVHADVPGNTCGHMVQHAGDYAAARAQAAHVFRDRVVIERGASSPMETRGVLAFPDPTGCLTVWCSTQAPIPLRNGLAHLLGLELNRIRVIAPDVGGGFGAKLVIYYPEELLVPIAALRLGRPVKWIEDRREHFVATTQERGQIHEVEVAVDGDGRLLGLKDVFLHDTGAYCAYGLIVPIVAQCTLPGPYKLKSYYTEYRSVFTNKPMVSPYRGAGRPHGVFVMERVIARIARELGLDPNEVRRRNFIQPDEFPYDLHMTYQDGAPLVYDSGNYPELLERALRMIDYERFKAETQPRARAQGRCLGVGVAVYVEGSGIGPYEGAQITVQPDGKVLMKTGVGTQGQGHYTSFAQIVADELGVRPEDVIVTTGDTGQFGWGTGTFASRAAVVVGNATYQAALAVKEKAKEVAARLLEADPADLELAGGQVRVQGAPQRAVPLGEVAANANPLRGTLPSPDYTPGLEVTRYFAPPAGTFASGAHACLVEVDAETGDVKILKYVVVHDCGRVINPMIVAGQVHGGVAQGIGGAFYEQLVFDDQAQLLTASFMDYLLPTAAEVPHLETDHLETPSPLNPLGIKGAGEAGVIPVPAVFAEAVGDALGGIPINEMPLNPGKVREYAERAGQP